MASTNTWLESPRFTWARLGCTALLYFLAGYIGLIFVSHPEDIAAIWPVSGVAVTILLLQEPRAWRSLLVVMFGANVTANLQAGNSLGASLGFAIANMLETLMSAWLILRLTSGVPPTFTRLRDTLALLVGALGTTMGTALIGASVPYVAFGAPYWQTWLLWWIADGLGILLIVPLVMVWWQRPYLHKGTVLQNLEYVLILIIFAIFLWVIFGTVEINLSGLLSRNGFLNRTYILFPLSIWAALRFPLRYTITLLALLAGTAIFNTINHTGTFAKETLTITEQILMGQTYVGVATITGLITASIFAERRLTEKALRAQQKFLTLLNENNLAALTHTQVLRLLPMLANRNAELFEANGCLMVLWDESTQRPTIIIPSTAYQPVPNNYSFSESHADLIARLLSAGQISPETIPLPNLYPAHPAIAHYGGIPLKAGDRKLGVIIIAFNAPRKFKAGELVGAELVQRQTELILNRLQLFEQVQALAITDELTGLYNRRHLLNHLETEFQRARRLHHALSVIMLDIDHFKQVNDTYGHALGDLTIQTVMQVCAKQLRGIDTMGRYGGDEFTIVLPETNSSEAQKVAERLRQVVAQVRIPAQGFAPLQSTISLGVAELSAQHANSDALLAQADAALYLAKNRGRNQVAVN